MPSYYFKTFRRSLLKNKASFLLNLLGLTLGISCFLFTLLFVFYERSFDAYHTRRDRFCRLVSDVHSGGNESKEAVAFGFLSNQLPKQFPEIEKIIRFDPFSGHAGLRWKPQGTLISQRSYADEGVFSVFSYPLTAGDAATCLKAPNSIVLTAGLEKRLFGKAPALGETVILNGKLLKVTGVMEELPGNTDLRFNGLISGNTIAKDEMNGWVYSYILFKTPGR